MTYTILLLMQTWTNLILVTSFPQDWNCSATASNFDKYGDLIPDGTTTTINGFGTYCDLNEYSFSISSSNIIYEAIKIWSIDYNQCMEYGCNNISITSHTSQDIDIDIKDVCDGTTDISLTSNSWNNTQCMLFM